MIIHIKMSEVQVEVRNAAGDLIGSFSDAAGFRKWRAQMQKERGEKKIAACIADQLIIDSPSLMSRLPPGELRSYATEVRAHTPSSKKASRGLRSLEGSVKSCARCCACCSPIKFYPSSTQVLS